MPGNLDEDQAVFFLVKAKGPVSSIAVRSSLGAYGSVTAVRPLNGSYTVEMTPQNTPINIPASLCAGKVVLDISPHIGPSNNHPGAEGTIYSAELADCDEETLLNELAAEDGTSQVLSVKQLPSRGKLKDSGRWLIRFKDNIPENMQLKCKLQLNVRLHVRMALRCKNCHEYGHHIDDCRNDPVCPTCSLPYTPTPSAPVSAARAAVAHTQ